MTNLSDEKIDKMIQLLEEILKWIRLKGVQRAKTTLNELVKTDIEKLIYQNSDGRTSREIAEAAGVSHMTVINYWSKWAKYGIVEEMRARGGTRYRRIFSLLDFGIEVPEVMAMFVKRAEVEGQESTKEKAPDGETLTKGSSNRSEG